MMKLEKSSAKLLIFCLAISLILSIFSLPALAGEKDEDKDEGKDEEGYVEFTKDHPLAEPKEGKAIIYVVRPTSIGFAIKSFFLCDDTILGINRGSSYFFDYVDPGKHVFWSKSENVDAIELEVEAGKTYYIQQQVQMGAFKARTKLELLNAEKGETALSKCKKHGTLTEKGREKGMEIAKEHKKDTQEDLDRRAKDAEKKADTK